MEAAHVDKGRHFVHVVDVLSVRAFGFEVADVFELFVAGGSHEFEGFVHAVAVEEQHFRFWLFFAAQEDASVHIVFGLKSCQGEDGWGQVLGAYEFVVDGAGFQASGQIGRAHV